jgi:formate-dependent nitrite reductase cytochrome c552 subunit
MRPGPLGIVIQASTVFALIPVLLALSPNAIVLAQEASSCIRCHENPEFLVENKKLYDYFQEWRASIHGQAGIGCVDCHGGNAKAETKEAAHREFRQSKRDSKVNFRNIPETCGKCHDGIYNAYMTSKHHALLTEQNVQQGPNCVTCHGSLNARKLTVNTVRAACQQCHNDKTGNHPDIPNRATHLLNDLNAIRGYSHYISVRASAEVASEASKVLGQGMEEVAEHWHTFDLDATQHKTEMLLEYARSKRKEVQKGSRPDND